MKRVSLFMIAVFSTAWVMAGSFREDKGKLEAAKNDVTAIIKLAESGNSLAQYRLGEIYENGIGVRADKGLSNKWYKKSRKGLESYIQTSTSKLDAAEVANMLEDMYFYGKGVRKNSDASYYYSELVKNWTHFGVIEALKSGAEDAQKKENIEDYKKRCIRENTEKISKVKSYQIKTTSFQQFKDDGWNFKDPSADSLGIVGVVFQEGEKAVYLGVLRPPPAAAYITVTGSSVSQQFYEEDGKFNLDFPPPEFAFVFCMMKFWDNILDQLSWSEEYSRLAQ